MSQKRVKIPHEFDGFFKKSGDLGALDESDVHRKYVILANYISSSLEKLGEKMMQASLHLLVISYSGSNVGKTC